MLIVQESLRLPGVHFMRLVGQPTDDELEVYLAGERERAPALAVRPLVVIFELKEVWSSRQRRRISEFELELGKQFRRPSVGMVMVLVSSLIRGAFTAFFWFAPPNFPTKIAGSAREAWPWVQEQLTAAGVTMPTEEEYLAEALATWPSRMAVPGEGMVAIEETRLAELMER